MRKKYWTIEIINPCMFILITGMVKFTLKTFN